MSLAANEVYKRLDSVVTRCIVGETLLVPVSGQLANLDDLFTLNPTAAYVWERLDGSTPLDEIHTGLTATYAVESAQAWEDLRELTEALLGAELIEKMESQ